MGFFGFMSINKSHGFGDCIVVHFYKIFKGFIFCKTLIDRSDLFQFSSLINNEASRIKLDSSTHLGMLEVESSDGDIPMLNVDRIH